MSDSCIIAAKGGEIRWRAQQLCLRRCRRRRRQRPQEQWQLAHVVDASSSSNPLTTGRRAAHSTARTSPAAKSQRCGVARLERHSLWHIIHCASPSWCRHLHGDDRDADKVLRLIACCAHCRQLDSAGKATNRRTSCALWWGGLASSSECQRSTWGGEACCCISEAQVRARALADLLAALRTAGCLMPLPTHPPACLPLPRPVAVLPVLGLLWGGR